MQVIRVIMDELSRIASHCLFIGTFCMDLGATTMLFYTLRVREQILDIMDKTCGARMTFNYDTIGGVMQDLHPDFVKDVKALARSASGQPQGIRQTVHKQRYHTQPYGGRRIYEPRGCRHLVGDGSVGTCVGLVCDIRKTNPYSIYQELDFEQVVMHEGDAMARFKVRMKEIEESAKIIAQLIDNIPDGEIQAKVSKVFKLPAGHWFRTVEGCRGAFGVYLESDGTVNPYRIKLVPPCLLKLQPLSII